MSVSSEFLESSKAESSSQVFVEFSYQLLLDVENVIISKPNKENILAVISTHKSLENFCEALEPSTSKSQLLKFIEYSSDYYERMISMVTCFLMNHTPEIIYLDPHAEGMSKIQG